MPLFSTVIFCLPVTLMTEESGAGAGQRTGLSGSGRHRSSKSAGAVGVASQQVLLVKAAWQSRVANKGGFAGIANPVCDDGKSDRDRLACT